MHQNENKSRADGAPFELVMTANVQKLQNPRAGFDFNQLGSAEQVTSYSSLKTDGEHFID